MRLETFLINEGRSQVINRDKAIAIIRKSHMDAFNTWIKHDSALYRGQTTDVGPYGFIQPSKFSRKSANTSNHYTLWMDNNRDWAKFPKRSQSIICGANFGGAYGSPGERYLILPKDGSKIGVAPKEDLWDSFQRHYSSFYNFNDDLAQLYNVLVERKSIASGDWKEFKKHLEILNRTWEDLPESAIKTFRDKYPFNQLAKLAWEEKQNITDTISDIIQPRGFKLIKAGDKIPSGMHECWTDGDSIMIGYAVHYDYNDKRDFIMDVLDINEQEFDEMNMKV